MYAPCRTQNARTSAVFILQLLSISALALTPHRLSPSEPVPSLAQTAETASKMEQAQKLKKLRDLYRENPVMFLYTLDQKLAEKQAMMRTGKVVAEPNAPKYPFEPLLDVDYILDSDNYLEDFIDAPGITAAAAAAYVDAPVSAKAAPSPSPCPCAEPTEFAVHATNVEIPNTTNVTRLAVHGNMASFNEQVPNPNIVAANVQTLQGNITALAQKIDTLRAEVQEVLTMISGGGTAIHVSPSNL